MNKNTNKPKITVLMPVYNGEKYLKEAIESILNQTFTDFEFLIINDGSTDSSEEIIKSYLDSRIRLINNGSNLKLIKTLNKGLDLAKGKYIARMDADDISLPKRLAIQVEFMDKNPSIGIAGTWAKIINRNKVIKHFSDPEKIKVNLLFGSSLVHPSTIIDKEKIDNYNLRYNKNSLHSEDYDLWIKAIKHFPLSNIKKILLLYRVHDSNTGKLNIKILKETSTKIRKEQLLNNLEIETSDENLSEHQSTRKPKNIKIKKFLNNKEEWFNKLIGQNKKTRFYKEPQFSQVLAQRWLKICSINANYDFGRWKRFWNSSLRKKLDLKEFGNWRTMFRFFFKCLLKNKK